jgi:hypothetical protein
MLVSAAISSGLTETVAAGVGDETGVDPGAGAAEHPATTTLNAMVRATAETNLAIAFFMISPS